MHRLIDHLDKLTRGRDRDLLDVTLALAVRDILAPHSVVVAGVAKDGDERRWLELARVHADGRTLVTDPMWADLEHLPALHEFPARVQCLQGRGFTQVEEDTGVWLTLVPLFGPAHTADQGVLELRSEAALSEQAQDAVLALLRIYRNMHGLLEYSERDALTGLRNRKSFDDAFFKALKTEMNNPAADSDESLADVSAVPERRSQATVGGRFWLGMLDIDHFKRVNDVHGHLIGDEVLLLVARILHSTLRFHDRVFRFGGEEFVVLVRCPDPTAAGRALERIRQAMELYSFPQVGRITVSIGFSQVLAGDSPAAATERADKAVYYAKHHGRNQVAAHAELVERGLLDADTRSGDIELF